jgi:alpha-ketoglutarate-dependent taurine dioxygenase
VTGAGGVPVLSIHPAEAAHLNDSLASVEVNEDALHEPSYQATVLNSVRDAVGSKFDEIVEQAAKRLAERPWFIVVRGLPPERATSILVAISATLGELVEPYRQPWSRVVRHIVPDRDRAVDGRALNEFLHTDGTDWAQPNDYTCLFCVRPDQSHDGESRLLDVSALLDEATGAPDRELISRLATEPLPWRIADELGGGVHWQPAVDLADPSIRWLRYTVDLSLVEGVASLPKHTQDDLQAFERLVEGCRGVRRTRLQAGDLLLIDNRRSLHARTTISDPARSERELLRTKVTRKGSSQ